MCVQWMHAGRSRDGKGAGTMLAYVLSGGGSLGALQAGALEVLLERGPRPQIVVGTSAGALNAIFVAVDPTPRGARAMQRVGQGAQPAPPRPPTLFPPPPPFL